jgi:hypothetical protein
MGIAQSGLVETAITAVMWGKPAAGTAPHVRFLVDGAVVGEAWVTSASATPYTVKAIVDPAKAHRVQVHYDNDAVINGVDRNVYVQSLRIGDLTVAPTDKSVSYDRGALDGKDIMAGRSDLLWGGALTLTASADAFASSPAPAAPLTTAFVTVNARGVPAGGVAPHFRLLVDGKAVGEASVTAATDTAYAFKVLVDGSKPHTVQVHYDNDAVVGGVDRNLFVRSIAVNGQEIAAGDSRVTYDRGALDGKDMLSGRETMYWGGALKVTLPAETFTPPPPTDDHKAVAALSADRPPLANEVWALSWGADRGLAPQHIFWTQVPDYANASHMAQTRAIAAEHEADGQIPVAGMQLWTDTFAKSLSGGEFASLAGHKAWVDWVKARPDYMASHPDGRVWGATAANPSGWGYVSPLMPMKAADTPAGWSGTYYYADWLADRLGQLAAHTGIRGYNFADFYDGSPHAGIMDFFNDRMITDFATKTGITVAGSSLATRAADIRAHHAVEYVDYFVKGWSYGWKALAQSIEHYTGKEAWLTTQVSFGPAVMRQFAGVDVRELGNQGMDLDSIVFNVQTLERFTMQHKAISVAYESAMIGTHAARAPDGHFGQMVSASEDAYWDAVANLYTRIDAADRNEIGWDRLKQAWFQSGWTHIAENDGGVRRAAEVWQRSYHDWGQIDDEWLDVLRDVVPTKPFGPALYYSVNAERAVNVLDPLGYAISNAYLGETLQPITKLFDAGATFGYYVSDSALAHLSADATPSAWIIPQRTLNGKDLFSSTEIAALQAKAPVLSETQAATAHYPLTFTDNSADAQTDGYAFYDQHGRLIVLACDRIDFDDTSARQATMVTAHLDLTDGHYQAVNLFDGHAIDFDAVHGSGAFAFDLGRWDTTAFAITNEA